MCGAMIRELRRLAKMAPRRRRIAGEAAERDRLIWRGGDLQARYLLIRLSEDAYRRGELEACAMLYHAEMYLADRLAYALSPSPSKWAIPTAESLERPLQPGSTDQRSTEDHT